MRTVLCFGDSNTHGTIAMSDLNSRGRFPKAQRWPSVMAALLGSGVEVIAEGHPGRTAAFDDPVEGAHKNGLSVLPALLESHRPMDLLIIMLGTNDMKARFGVPPVDVALALDRLAVCAIQSGAGPKGGAPQILFVSPVPLQERGALADMFAGGAAKSRALAGHLKPISERRGAAFLDLADVAQADPVDGVHLSREAHAAIGAAIAAKAQELLA